MTATALYGLLAEFESPAGLVAAIRRAREAGYADLEAFAPVPVDEACAELGRRGTWVPALALLGGLTGAAVGYFVQYYTNVIDYPINVGGRPLHAWPAFAVVAIELAILFAALGAAVGMFALCGLPRPHHPLFGVPAFGLASQTRFFLCVRATDPKFDPEATRQFLSGYGAAGVWEVPL
jgi:hypothetical protein